MDTLTPDELNSALIGIVEDEKEQYRMHVYPVWLTAGEKGQTWDRFLAGVGLSYSEKTEAKPKAKPRKDTSEIYILADRIKRKHLRRE